MVRKKTILIKNYFREAVSFCWGITTPPRPCSPIYPSLQSATMWWRPKSHCKHERGNTVRKTTLMLKWTNKNKTEVQKLGNTCPRGNLCCTVSKPPMEVVWLLYSNKLQFFSAANCLIISKTLCKITWDWNKTILWFCHYY